MTNATTESMVDPAVPLTFAVNQSWCFGWYHKACHPLRGVGVVLCRPIGYEANCSYSAYMQLAQVLALAGFDVMRFDYLGAGDSAGGDGDPDCVNSWTASIVAAANELKRLAGVSQLSFFGMRLGATLAVKAALQIGGLESMVMWAPCRTGYAFERELRAASASRSTTAGPMARDGLEALGYYFSSRTLEGLKTLDCLQLQAGSVKHLLLLGRDDMPLDQKLVSGCRDLGIDTTYSVATDYALMMSEPRQTMFPFAMLDVLKDWMQARHPLPAVESAAVLAHEGHLPEPGLQEIDRTDGRVRETNAVFGAGQALFGILSERLEAVPDRREETAVLLLNVGGNYRIGPNRIYVKMARELAAAGYRVLRFDLAGRGDSQSTSGFSFGSLYSRDSTAEVGAAIDYLAATGSKRFYLMGICSGSYVAFQTARIDARVTGQVLMNSRLLEWQDESAAGEWQRSMQQYYKSSVFYRQALVQPGVYRRLLSGKVDAKGIARRLLSVAAANLKRSCKELLHRVTPAEGVLAQVQALAARGTDTLMVIAAEDDGRDYVEFHFGRMGKRMRGNPRFRMVMVENADHTFSSLSSQQVLFGLIREHLDKATAELEQRPAEQAKLQRGAGYDELPVSAPQAGPLQQR